MAKLLAEATSAMGKSGEYNVGFDNTSEDVVSLKQLHSPKNLPLEFLEVNLGKHRSAAGISRSLDNEKTPNDLHY